MATYVIRQVVSELDCAQQLPQRLCSGYRGLELIEYTIRELAYLAPERHPSGWKAVQSHAASARADLARAPSFPWPPSAPPPVPALALADELSLVDELAALAERVVLTLVEASAEATEVADHRACLAGAIRTCLLQQQLQLTTPASAGMDPR